jgi:hypothetical protein
MELVINPGRISIICMPLKRHIPETKNSDWKLTTCPECGDECWESDLARQVKATGCGAVCTVCALRVGMSKQDGRE